MYEIYEFPQEWITDFFLFFFFFKKKKKQKKKNGDLKKIFLINCCLISLK